MVNATLLSHPAQLWVGQQSILRSECVRQLHLLFCTCLEESCLTQQQLISQQHYAVISLAPEKTVYIRSQFDELFARVRYQLNENENIYIIFEKADLLSPACANSLLKLIEEPPRGYHFIFFTAHKDAVIPTITSRCVEYFFNEEALDDPYAPFVDLLCNPHYYQMSQFVKLYEQQPLTDVQAAELFDILRQRIYKNRVESKQLDSKASRLLASLELLADRSPMPGSSKLFLRTLFLQLAAL